MDETFSLIVGSATDPGLVRRENQDALEVHIPDDPTMRRERGALFAVCDGVGGLSAGGQASRLALRHFFRAYYTLPPDRCEHLLRQAADLANAKLFEINQQRGPRTRMATTLVASVLSGGELWVTSIGDSRAYLWHALSLNQLTQDHAPDRRHASDRRINRALGIEHHVSVDLFGPFKLTIGDCLLLCTDGLSTAVDDRTIAKTLQEFSGQPAARRLLAQAQTAGASDNISIIVVNVAEPTREIVRWSDWRKAFYAIRKQMVWDRLDPWKTVNTGRWRTRQGLVTLLVWILLALLVGLLIGWINSLTISPVS